MQLISQYLFPRQLKSVKRSLIRGLSTAELVGIIVIVGILGALGGTYITGLITQSKINTGNQNAQSLTTTMSSAIAGGYTFASTDGPTVIGLLNTGVVANGVTYQMNPPISVSSMPFYTLTNATFTYASTATGATP